MKLDQERIDRYNEVIGYFVELGLSEIDEFTEETPREIVQLNGIQAILVITAEITLDILRILNQNERG